MFRKILSSFLAWRIVLFIFTVAAMYILPFQQAFSALNYGHNPPYHLFVWGNFDGYHYMKIAQIGYLPHLYPFFPLYPIFIRLIVEILHIHFYLRGAQIISNASFITGLFFVGKLLQQDKKANLFPLLLMVTFFYPTSFFYTAAYNDSLFFLFATLTMYFGRKKAWTVSSLFGALATLTRLNGLALFFFILLEYFPTIESVKRISLKKILKDRIFMLVLIPLVFIGFLFYIHLISGSFMNIFSAMKEWNQDKVTFPLQVFWRYLKILTLTSPTLLNYWIAALEISSVLLYIGLLTYSYNKIRLSYWVLFALSILIPSLTGTFQGMPRYGLHLYPFFLTLTLYLHERSRLFKIIYFTVCFVLLFLLVALFTRGYFVA